MQTAATIATSDSINDKTQSNTSFVWAQNTIAAHIQHVLKTQPDGTQLSSNTCYFTTLSCFKMDFVSVAVIYFISSVSHKQTHLKSALTFILHLCSSSTAQRQTWLSLPSQQQERSRSDGKDLSWTKPWSHINALCCLWLEYFSMDNIKLLPKYLTTSGTTEQIQSDRWKNAREQQQRVRKGEDDVLTGTWLTLMANSTKTCMLFIGKMHVCYSRTFITSGASFTTKTFQHLQQKKLSFIPTNGILMWGGISTPVL